MRPFLAKVLTCDLPQVGGNLSFQSSFRIEATFIQVPMTAVSLYLTVHKFSVPESSPRQQQQHLETKSKQDVRSCDGMINGTRSR